MAKSHPFSGLSIEKCYLDLEASLSVES